MNFLLHIDPETGKKKLYPNKTHTPKELLPHCKEIDIDISKDGLMAAFNELFDQIPAEIGQETAQECENTPPGPDTLVFPAEGDLSVSEQLQLRRLVDRNWEFFPHAYKCDLTGAFFEGIRGMKPVNQE